MKSLLFNKYFILGFVVLAISTWMQIYPSLDYKIQSLFYNSHEKTWLIQETKFFRLALYTIPKVLIAIASLLLIYWYSKHSDPLRMRKIFAFLFCLIFIPTLVSLIKSKTNIHCPNDLSDFNGKVPFRSLIDFNSYTSILKIYGNGNCFPGGHCSGGYACMSSFLILDDLYKKSGIIIGFLLGTYMALYQMTKGAHFLSHTLFTFGFSIIVINFVYLFVNPIQKEPD